MDLNMKRLNPCEYENYVRIMAWAETECWCCTATRALLVAFVLGFFLGLVCSGKFAAAAFFIVIAGPLTVAALVIARRVWKDSYTSEVEGNGHQS
jgi:ABC-type iron transport system FetAB permease component